MWFKCIGSLLLCGAGGYLAVLLSRYERQRLSVLDGYLALLRYIKGQIDCFSMPMEDIMASVSPSVISACRGEREIRRIYDLPYAETIPTFQGLVHQSRNYLGRETERLLSSFSSECGHTYRAEQVGRCEYYISALGEERRRLADALPGRLRTSSTICISCAIAAAVLLW